MKILITLTLLSMLFVSCDRQNKRIFRKYIVENQTDRKIKLDIYRFNRFHYSKEKVGKGLIHEGMSNDDTGKMIAAYKALQADSIIIYFDDTRRIIYLKANSFPMFRGIPNNKKNILNDSSYTQESNTLYRYTFTEEDYINAEVL